MINKKNVLGKTPFDLGDKDAIHVAIVSVRAAQHITPGSRIGFNEFNEAVPRDKGPGVADPFRRTISRGDSFWMLLAQDEVPNVRHVWEHPKIKFDPPTRPAQENRWLADIAKTMGVTYQQLMEACDSYVQNERPVAYRGTLASEDEMVEAWVNDVESGEMWSEWSDETGHEFENQGSACCPEHEYPCGIIFKFVGDMPQTAEEAKDRE